MGRNTLRDDYFLWLYKSIESKPRSYMKLCRELHKKRFRWFIHNDDNRCEDGLDIRDNFFEEKQLDESFVEVEYWLREDCTVFEVLVALAKRMNDLMFDLKHQEDHTAKWFFEMIQNLGLTRFSDSYSRDTRFDPVTEATIDEILEVLMDRTYGSDGRGGLFPLKKRHKEDQSKVEIWYQMMYWLEENYG